MREQAAAGAEFDEIDMLRRPQNAPHFVELAGEKTAEDFVDVARRVEVTTLAELLPYCASNSHALDRTGNVPCSARSEWGHAREFPVQFPGEADSQFLPATFGAVLRSADEHLAEIIVQRVVELALEAPFKLRVVEVARVQVEVIRVHRDRGVFELNDYFHAFALGARGEIQQRMLVETELGEDSVQAGGGGLGHRGIVKQVKMLWVRGFGVRTRFLYNTSGGNLLTETTYTHLRQSLASVLDRVADDREVVIVVRKGERKVAMVPADELAGLMETAHLLRSPKNARRLLMALRRATRGRANLSF